MNLLNWFGWPKSPRAVAMSSYKRGLARASANEPAGALEDFTAAIELPDAPSDVIAMALYNRALLYAALHETQKANADLEAVLASDSPLADIKLAAKRRLERLRTRSSIQSATRSTNKTAQQS